MCVIGKFRPEKPPAGSLRTVLGFLGVVHGPSDLGTPDFYSSGIKMSPFSLQGVGFRRSGFQKATQTIDMPLFQTYAPKWAADRNRPLETTLQWDTLFSELSSELPSFIWKFGLMKMMPGFPNMRALVIMITRSNIYS